MIEPLYIYLFLCVLVSGTFIFTLMKFPIKECADIDNDMLLSTYRYEMKNQRNDGWVMQHYREKYLERLHLLLKKKNVHLYWWKLYNATREKVYIDA